MTESVAHPEADAPKRRGRPGWIVPLVLAPALLGSGLYFVLHGELNADEGFYLLASRLVSEGLHPYADFGFTQTPLTAYANLPWLHLFGFDLLGVRLAGLTWTGLSIALALLVGLRTEVRSQTMFLLLLAASPGWMAFAVKGKTYAVAGFAVTMGALALRSTLKWPARWLLFLTAALLGTCARLPVAAFFMAGGIALLAATPGWKRRAAVLALTGALTAATIWLIAHGAWEQAWFWTVDFHRHVSFDRALSARVREFFATAPSVWTAFLICGVFAVRRIRARCPMLELALLASILANLGRKTTYGEYLVPFVPAAALAVAPWITAHLQRWSFRSRTAATGCILLGALILPKTSRTVLDHAAAAVSILRTHVPAGGYVLASMPEIPVASGHKTYPQLAPGKFALTEELPADAANRLHLVTPASLLELIADQRTQALALSDAWNWNFGWSVPSMRWVSAPQRERIRRAIQDHYDLVYHSSDYVIFLRKKPAQ